MQDMSRGRCPGSKLAGNEGSRTGLRGWAAWQPHQRPWGIPSGSLAELPELGPQNWAFVPSPNVPGCGLSRGESVALKPLPRGGTRLQTDSCRRSPWSGKERFSVGGSGDTRATVPPAAGALKPETGYTWAPLGVLMEGFLHQRELKLGLKLMGTI